MPDYSSDDFNRDWQYAVETEFSDASGQQFVYADDGKRTWGDELKCIKFDSSPGRAAINHDRTLFAVVVDHDIHLYNAEFEPTSVLRGHTSRVDVIAFQPGRPDTLVSCAMDDFGGTRQEESIILFWNLNERGSWGSTIHNRDVKRISSDAAESVRNSLAMLNPPFNLSPTVQQTLSETFELPIAHGITRSNAEQCRSINGDLMLHFQSNVFSPTGKFMMYTPGKRPRSNGDDQWDIKIRSLPEHEDILTLSGHRDAIMWTGYDRSEKLIGTAAWDRTFRIWSAETGQEKYKFQTSGQNWTAGFSPDSRLFAGTSGDGKIHVYSLNDGSKLFQLDLGRGWFRALDWMSDSKMLAVGGERRGSIFLIDVGKKEIVQKRVLSTVKAKVEGEMLLGLVDRRLGVSAVKFADQGRKLIFWTFGDGSAEAYDLAAGTKWRFAREGTRSYEDDKQSDKGSDKTKKAPFKGGHGGMAVWEDPAKGRVMVATIDHDAVRIWSLKMDSSDVVSAGAG